MSSTETSRVEKLANDTFDNAISPLARTRQSTGTPVFFPQRPDAEADSYFTFLEPASSKGSQLVAYPGGGKAPELIDALAAFWTEQGAADLAALSPHLRKLADAVAEERRQQSGDVDIYCYTMF